MPVRTVLLRRILVAEDDVVIRQLNGRALASSGYQVDAAEDGEIAWQALNTCSYDLLVTDHDMPGMSGLQLLVKLRAARMVLPVIVASGYVSKNTAAQFPSLHPVTALLKPYTISELVRTVEALLCTTDNACKDAESSENRQNPKPIFGSSL